MCKTAVVETTISSEIGGKSSSSGDSIANTASRDWGGAGSMVSRKLRRADALGFFKKLSPCLVGMGAPCPDAASKALQCKCVLHRTKIILSHIGSESD